MFLVVATKKGTPSIMKAYSIHATEAEAIAEIRWVHARRADLQGATFAIWGPIFALQGGGVWLLGWGAPGGARAAAAGGAWLATWAAEVVWQGVFATAPIPASKAGDARKLATLAPAAALLVAAHVP